MDRIVIAVAFSLVIIAEPLYIFLAHKKFKKPAVALKCFGTVICAFLGLYGALVSDKGWLAVPALFVCAAADGILEYNFPAGTAVFAVGHLLYISAFIGITPLGWYSLVAAVVITAVLIVILKKIIPSGKLAVLMICYAVIIGAMFSVAAPMFVTGKIWGILISIGGVLFCFSDGYLSLKLNKKTAVHDDIIIMTTYYGAQFLFALSLLFL